jgi:cell division protein FtsB
MAEPVCCRWCGQDFEATKAMRAENERLKADNMKLRTEVHRLYEVEKEDVAHIVRLRELLRGVVREADRETNAFIAARAELEQAKGE